MSLDRCQDLLNRPGRRPEEEAQPPEDWARPWHSGLEQRLGSDIARCRQDERALLALLRGLPSDRWHTGRLVAIRELGPERGNLLCLRAFGAGRASFPLSKAAAQPEATVPLHARYDYARARGLVDLFEGILQLDGPKDPQLFSDLLTGTDRRVALTTLSLLRGRSEVDLAPIGAALHQGRAAPTPAGPLHGAAERRAASLFRREQPGGDPTDPDHPAVQEALRRVGQGDPLPPALRRTLEAQLGFRLHRVRVHSDALAHQATQALRAEAFTVGEDIFFAAGAYQPASPSGLLLLTHELTHVVQGYQGRVAPPPTGTVQVSQPGDALEAEAEQTALSLRQRLAQAVEQHRAQEGHGLPQNPVPSPTTTAPPQVLQRGVLGDAASWTKKKAGEVVDALNPMEWLRDNFPKVAQLLDEGLDGLLKDLGDLAWGALKPVLEGLGIDKLLDAFSGVAAALSPDSMAFGVLTGCCSCLEEALDTVLQKLEGLLASDGGKQLQQRIAKAQQKEKDSILDLLTDFFGLLQKVGGPIMTVINTVESAVNKARSVVGKLGDLVWGEIADRLGLDKSLGPIGAMKAKLAELWKKAASALAPISGALKAILAVVTAPLAPFLALFQAIPAIVAAIKKLRAIKAANAKEWLAAAAKVLAGTVFGPLIAALQAGEAALSAAAAFVAGIFKTISDSLSQLQAVKSAVAFVKAITDGISAFAAKVRATVDAIASAIKGALTTAGEAVKKIYQAVKPLLDFVAGLVVALNLTAMGNLFALPAFVLGNLFIHVLPDCYKVAVLDFILKAFIALIEWYPATGMPLTRVVKAGALGYLKRLLAASPEQKAKGMNLIASLFAGNVEFLAGLLVGVVKGVYESTIGTVVFVFEAAGWLASIGGEALRFAATPMSEVLREVDEANDGGEAENGEGSASAPAEARKDEEKDDEKEEEAAVTLGEDEDSAAPEEDGEGAAGGDEEGAFEGPADEADEDAAPQQQAPGRAEAAEAAAPQESMDLEPPPPLPDLASGRALFEAVFKKGISREELEALLNTMNTGLEAAADKSGAAAAEAIIKALNSNSAAYDIGQVVGFVVGMVVVEAAIIYFTGPAGAAKTGLTLTKLGIKGVKGLRGVMTALRGVAKALKPILAAFQKLKGALAAWARAVAKYIDDLIRWAERTIKKLLARLKGKKPPKKKPPGKKPPGKKPPKKRGKDRDQLRLAAMKGAQKGWSHLQSSLGSQLHKKTEVKAKLRAVKVPVSKGVKVALSLASLSSGWKVKALARKGVKSKSWKTGSGWITTKYKSTQKFYAIKSYKKLHNDIIDDALKELQKKNDQPDDLKAEYEAKKKEAERVEKAGQGRITLKGVTFKIDLEPYRGVEKDLEVMTEFVISPNATVKKRSLPLGSTEDLDKAKAALPKQLFTTKKLAEVLGKSTDMAQKRTQEWVKADLLYKWQSGLKDPKTEYTFSKKMAGKRPMADGESNRSKYGYVNPGQTSGKGIIILSKGHRAGSPAPPADDSRYDSMSEGVRKTSGPYSDFPRVQGGRTLAVLGHKYPAVKNWNDGLGGPLPGHKQTYDQNYAWNQDTDNYWGPEHYKESGREGGTIGARYEVPRESIGSHESWWNVED